MSAAVDALPPQGGGKKKLLLIVVAVLVLLALVAGAALVLLKMQRQTADRGYDDDDEIVSVDEAVSEMPRSAPPVFLPLDPFTFNLADKNIERYAQIGVTLEMVSPEAAERLKAYMPAVRGNILMLLAHKRAEDLLDRAGKEKLAAEIMREAVQPMGIELPPVDDAEADDTSRSRKRKSRVRSPIRQVHFSNFIIQ